MSVCLLKNQIDNLLFKAEMDQYTHDTSVPQPLEQNLLSPQPPSTPSTSTQQARESPQSQNFNMQHYVQFY